MNQDRFLNFAKLYQDGALELFKSKRVCIIGIGGIGSWICESLARSGIGHICLIDLDDICVTNINRQVHALTSTCGQIKTHVMRKRMLDINPLLDVKIIDDFLSVENISHYINDFDYVIDAIDNAKIKTQLALHCLINKFNLLIIGAAGGKLNPSLVKIKDLSYVTHDPLLAKVRYNLRKINSKFKDKVKFKLNCVYSSESIFTKDKNSRLNCDGALGSASFLTASFAFHASYFVLNNFIQKR